MYNTLNDALADAKANTHGIAARIAFAKALATTVADLTSDSTAHDAAVDLAGVLEDVTLDVMPTDKAHVLYFNTAKGKWFYVQKDVDADKLSDVVVAQLSAGRTVKVKPTR